MTTADHYRQAALDEMSALRAQLDTLARRWTHTAVLEANADEAHARLAYADTMLGKVYDVIANDGLNQQARSEAGANAEHQRFLLMRRTKRPV